MKTKVNIKNRLKIFITIAPFLFGACALEKPKPFIGPNGGIAYSMRCGVDVEHCYREAGELCPKGYIIIDKALSTIGAPTRYGGTIISTDQHLTIECKQEPGAPKKGGGYSI